MARADLHVHSRFSHHASEWFLQRIGAAESYTSPEEVYRLARERGMDFVTITDHNQYRGSLQLMEKHPERCFSGMEATAYFPADGCKVHILLYGLAPSQFEKVHELRRDIYQLRDYIRENRFAHSVSHGTYSVNGRLTMEHLERLILLFDSFEGLNGGRNRMHNETWKQVLSSLTPESVDRLRRKHGIEPFGAEPWVKGFTGGSDDHAGVFIGRGFTVAAASSPGEFLDRIRDKHVGCEGRHNDFASFAFTVYKVAYDFSREKGGSLAVSPLTRLGRIIFEGRKLSLVERIKLRALKLTGARKPDRIAGLVAGLVEELRHPSADDIERRLEVVYDRTTQIADEFFRSLLVSLEKDLGDLDLVRVIHSLSAALPGLFLTVPFFTAFNHMYQDRELIGELREKMLGEDRRCTGKILWFTDTLTEANGVAVTLRQAARQCALEGRAVRVVTCLPAGEVPRDVPGLLNLPPLHSFPLPYYESLRLHVPSLLSALKAIYEEDPDEVIVSTPGPVGLMGVLAARLLNVPSVGIYHSDFGREAAALVRDDSVAALVDGYVDWFYGTFPEVRVPSAPCREALEGRGLPADRLKPFRRGVDLARFSPSGRESAGGKAVHLLYVGRVSRDKNIEHLLNVCDALGNKAGDIELTIVGGGPGLEELRRLRRHDSRIHFMGEVAHEKLPFHYRQADLFLFPSNTDTLGVAVAEAQACGVPCLVSDAGGPHTVIRDGLTGRVAAADDVADWAEKALSLIRLRKQDPEAFSRMRRAARLWAQSQFSWAEALEELLGPLPEPQRGMTVAANPGLLESASA